MSDTLKSYDPSNNELLGEVNITSAAELEQVVAQARTSALQWSRLTLAQRQQRLEQAFSSVEPQQNQLAALLSREMGKDLRRASGEVSGAIYSAAYIAQFARAALITEQLDQGSQLQYRPLGVVAVISPWNYPLAMACNLIVPALMAGNSVIFKPSEETPLIAQAFVELLNKVLPTHLLQIVHGNGELGKALVDSEVNLIAFTGSRHAGKDIMSRAAKGLKRLVMELGGNDPMIVMADAHLESAARFAVASSLENAGQMCTSTERIYVDSTIADQFERRVVEIIARYKVGAWNVPDAQIGPIVNAKQHQQINRHISDALNKGGQLLFGAVNQALPYIKPTVITGLTPDMLMEQEETFGPVVAISHFDDIEQAIARANDSDFALGAVVFGASGAQDVAERLEAGMVAINQGVGGSGDSPWVGAKQSGFGFHGSAAGHRQFSQVKVLSKR